MITYFAMDGINPEPWKAPGAQAGRRGNGVFATLIKDGRLTAYQEAIREQLEDHTIVRYPDDQYLRLEMFFWRKLEEYTPTLGRKTKRKWADATNMGKALEDALQGVLFKNDSKVVCPVPRIIQQDDTPTFKEGFLVVVQPMDPMEAWWCPSNYLDVVYRLNSHRTKFIQYNPTERQHP